MRVGQLCELAKTHLGDRYEFSCLAIPKRPDWRIKFWIARQKPGAIYIFSKFAARVWRKDHIADLRRKAAGICVDYVDLPLDEIVKKGVDFHLSTSYAGQRALDKIIANASRDGAPIEGQTRLLLHNVDRAFDKFLPNSQPDLATVYLGMKESTLTTPEIEKQVTFLDGSQKDSFDENVKSLQNFNFHYCIRDDQSDNLVRSYKPLTKGFIAARCGANLLINRNVDDAEEFLGSDYPYFVETKDPAEILEGLNKARRTFGKKEWHAALNVGKKVATRVSHTAIAAQLGSILDEFQS
ncbi:hypothetical protein RB2150_12016 [Rhodobacteraceae bacterium HTCC2150]|nr:hypothetical protein RB2150_12016 [Rhodobacteraceae bacterium HTCC2150]